MSVTSPKNPRTLLWVVGGLLGFALILGLAFAIASEEDVDPDSGFGVVFVSSDQPALPVFTDPASDSSLGMVAPQVSGTDWDGNETTISADGRPKMVVFLAHWCPHCQSEVPALQSWVNAGGLPAGVDLIAVTSLTERVRPNWPPQNWLVREGWSSPVIMDDASDSVARAFGMAGTPYWVLLDGENRVLGRLAGEVGVNGFDTFAAIAAESSNSANLTSE